MRMFEFTLVLDSGVDLTEGVEDALFEAGLDDVLVGSRDDIVFIDFEREGESFVDVALFAVQQVEAALPGAIVLRVEPDELVSAADIAARVGRTRESIRLLVGGHRGPGGFPAPVHGIASKQRLWRWGEVAQWLFSCVPCSVTEAEVETAQAISTLNSALYLRKYPSRVAQRLLDRLAG